MTQYENAPYEERFKTLGDTSEAAFEQWARKRNINFERFGFNRPSIQKVFKIDERLRLIPDYLCEGTDIVFVEVKGCGNSGVKVKLESLRIMGFWNDNFHPVKVFIYNSATKKWAMIDWEELDMIAAGREVHEFGDKSHKQYYNIPVDEFTWETL